MEERNSIYFASDFHLGSPNHKDSLIRERKICYWLDSIKNTAKEIYLVGDVFDFWFEYQNAIPKGFERFKGKIAEFKMLAWKHIMVVELSPYLLLQGDGIAV